MANTEHNKNHAHAYAVGNVVVLALVIQNIELARTAVLPDSCDRKNGLPNIKIIKKGCTH